MAELSSGEMNEKRHVARKVASICAIVILSVICAVLLIHSLLCVFADGYYPTFGGYRLFAIVSDSMEPEIPTGNMIVGRVPESADEIEVGTVITFEVKNQGTTYLLTHRVTAVKVDESTGKIVYTTKGDNAAGVDSVSPSFDDVVGIFIGKQCGFFGYLFGFLQSSQGAIALIIIALIIIVTVIIVWFLNLVNIWRKIALDAIEKSGALLAEADGEKANTVADVLGIVSKEPISKRDLNRKNKKLGWFLRTGSLPKRPYRDDIDEEAEMLSVIRQNEAGKTEFVPETETAKGTVSEISAVSEPMNESNVANSEAGLNDTHAPENVEQSAVATDVINGFEEVASVVAPIEKASEKVQYEYTCRARLIQLKPDGKEWYSVVKNELMSYVGMTAADSKSCERYAVARKTVARINVRGKTLCVSLALDPDGLTDPKYRVMRNKSNTPAKLKITSARQAKYAVELIIEMMDGLGIVKTVDYEPQDYYMPYEGIASLLSKGLVKRKKVNIPHVLEDCEKMSYDMTFEARLTQLKPECKDWYSLVKNELMSYKKVRVKEGKRGETYMFGRNTIAKINVRGKTVCLNLALDPERYSDAKYKVAVNRTGKTPLKYRLSSERRTQYAVELINDLMAGEGAEKDADYTPQDFRPEYESIVTLMSKGLAKRKLTNKTQEFAVELVKKQ